MGNNEGVQKKGAKWTEYLRKARVQTISMLVWMGSFHCGWEDNRREPPNTRTKPERKREVCSMRKRGQVGWREQLLNAGSETGDIHTK